MLSTIAEMKPLIQRTASAARSVRPPVHERTVVARSEMMPAFTTAPTMMNSPMKKNNVGHSTVLKISCTSSRATIIRTTAPVMAMVAPSSPRARLNRKPRIVSAMTASEEGTHDRGDHTRHQEEAVRRPLHATHGPDGDPLDDAGLRHHVRDDHHPRQQEDHVEVHEGERVALIDQLQQNDERSAQQGGKH